MKTIAVHNQKGGTGKTTTVINLADTFARHNYRVLIIDADPQGHIGRIFNIKSKITLYDLLIEDALISTCIIKARENISCIFSDATLEGAEILLGNQNPSGREQLLKVRMENLDYYNFVLIDCSPSLNLINQLALVYADELLIPINMDYLGMVGAMQIFDNLTMLQNELGNKTDILGIIPTFVDLRTNMTHQVLATLRETYKEKVLPYIRIDTKIQQAMAAHKTIYEYSPKSKGSLDYAKLGEVLLTNA